MMGSTFSARPLWIAAVVAVLSAPGSPVLRPASSQSLSNAESLAIVRVFQDLDSTVAPGAEVAVYRSDSLVFLRGFGMADLDLGIRISKRSVFLLASVSKQFTAYAIAVLAEEGRLSLDDDIRKWVPEMYAFPETVTIRHLVHHTSGLRDEFDLLGMAGWRMDDVITHDAILRLAYRQRALNFRPGEKYLYSNTGYTLLAEIIQRVTGESFRNWLSDNVFIPLGMTHTHVHDQHDELISDRVQGYEPDGKGGFRKQIYNYGNFGSTGVFTTAQDLGKWLSNLTSHRVGNTAALDRVEERGLLNNGDTLSYAFGLIHGEKHGHRRIGHSGWHRGFRTVALRFPDDSLSVIVLANSNAIDPTARALEVADIFFQPDMDELRQFSGTYFSDELDTSYRVVLEGDSLRVHHNRNDTFTLTWNGDDAFTTSAWYFENIVFTREDDRVTGFDGSTTRAKAVHFRAVKEEE